MVFFLFITMYGSDIKCGLLSKPTNFRYRKTIFVFFSSCTAHARKKSINYIHERIRVLHISFFVSFSLFLFVPLSRLRRGEFTLCVPKKKHYT